MSWEDVAAQRLGAQAPAVTQYLSAISVSYDWSPWIYEAANILDAAYPDRGWMDPSRGTSAGITDIIVGHATDGDPAAAQAGFAQVRPQLQATQKQQEASIQSEQATHGGSNMGLIALVAAAAAAYFTGGASLAVTEGAAIAAESTAAAWAADTAVVVAEANATAATVAATATAGEVAASVVDPLRAAVDAATAGASSAGAAAGSGAAAASTSALGGLLAPVKEFFSPVTSAISAINSFNKEVVLPITQPIASTISTVNALIQVIERDFKSGIKGLLQIPTDLGQALTSIDASWTRALAQLEMVQVRTASEIMVPGLTGSRPGALGLLSESFDAAFTAKSDTWEKPPTFTLGDMASVEAYKAWIESERQFINDQDSMAGQVMKLFMRVATVLQGLLIEREPVVELFRQEVQKQTPIQNLDNGTLQSLYQRKEIDAATVKEELQKQGFNSTRVDAMLALTRQLLDASTIVRLQQKELITGEVAGQMMAVLGYNEQDAGSFIYAALTVMPPDMVIELYRRGLFDEGSARTQLRRTGMEEAAIEGYMATSTRLLGLADYIQIAARGGAGAGVGTFNFLGQGAPTELAGRGRVLGIKPEDVDALWINHWAVLTPALAVDAYFKRILTEDQLTLSLRMANLPDELHKVFIETQRPVLRLSQVISLMSHKVITAPEAIDALYRLGFDQVTANYMVTLGIVQQKPTKAAVVDTLHGLSSGTVLGLFDLGTVLPDDAQALLVELGWTQGAAEATLGFHQEKQAAEERKAEADLIIARAKAGSITQADAQGQLIALNLQPGELIKAETRLTTAVSEHTKMPGEAKLLKMHKLGLLDYEATEAALVREGYSPTWAGLLIELELKSGTKDTQPE